MDHTSGNILENVMETITENLPKQKSVRFAEGENSVSSQMNRLFGRQKSIHNILGGGKSADVLLWKNKKISMGVLSAATAIWVLFEWLEYQFLSLLCFGLGIGMIIQFLWSNASVLVNRSSSEVPRLVIPNELYANIAVSVGAEVNRFLDFLQDVATGKNLKQFIMVVLSLWAAAIIGSWCNFLSVLYFGFVAAHTLPVFYERYEDEVDSFIYSLLGHAQSQYKKIDKDLLSKIPKGNLKGKKIE
ncbi:Reticulon-like protein B8 [Acorus calamus]|uniref:Reticulon-like protein n=1 Tax=Acorus calamus TaxID=4465 RepID=A0AAV9BYR9_ACOCL|nr:Reticulon-like protein B8 [Acorus calamus]